MTLINQKPLRNPIVLNRMHPHARGLCGAYIMNDNGHKIFDFTKNNHDIALNVANWESSGIASRNNDEYGLINNANNTLIRSDEGTIIYYIKSYASFTDGKNHRLIGGQGIPGFLLQAKSSANRLRMLHSNGTTPRSVEYSTSLIPNWLTGTQIVFQWRKSADIFDSKKMALNVDGVYKVPTVSSNATALDSFDMPSIFQFLNHFSVLTRYMDAVCYYMYIYNYAVYLQILSDIFVNPYAMFLLTQKGHNNYAGY